MWIPASTRPRLGPILLSAIGEEEEEVVVVVEAQFDQ
jgi:hypothetical protein